MLALSAAVLVPCYWHRRIAACDLASHTYNAWLAHLARNGRAPGVHIAWQWNNVLVDVALERLGSALGFIVAERLVVSACVLIFFWGAFAFVSAATGRAPWVLVPALAMMTYGYTFYMGFMNFYLSLGLAFLSAAVLWRGARGGWILGLGLAGLALIAHPLGVVCVGGVLAYSLLGQRTRGWTHCLLFLSSFAAVYLIHRYILRFKTEEWLGPRFWYMNGADQLVTFGGRYAPVAGAAVIVGIASLVVAATRDRKRGPPLKAIRISLEVWSLLVFAAAMFPEFIWLPGYPMPFGFLVSRLTCVTGVLGLSVLGSIQPRWWTLAGFASCAVVSFVFQYQDTGALNRMELQAEALVSGLPLGHRVSHTLWPSGGSRIRFIGHMVDRACIGRCFGYSNYEPSSGQFRLRVEPGSPVVADSVEAAGELDFGTYVVRREDLPMAQIDQCDKADLTKLCMRELTLGERTSGARRFLPR